MRGSSHTITGLFRKKSIASTVYWTRNNIDLSQSKTGKYIIGPLPCPLLTITNFDSKDDGEYKCHAKNDEKHVSSNSVHLQCIGNNYTYHSNI